MRLDDLEKLEAARVVFTDDECFSLNAEQHNENRHPYTCGRNSRHRPLIATRGGWRCADCDYKQDWAHGAVGGASHDERLLAIARAAAAHVKALDAEEAAAKLDIGTFLAVANVANMTRDNLRAALAKLEGGG